MQAADSSLCHKIPTTSRRYNTHIFVALLFGKFDFLFDFSCTDEQSSVLKKQFWLFNVWHLWLFCLTLFRTDETSSALILSQKFLIYKSLINKVNHDYSVDEGSSALILSKQKNGWLKNFVGPTVASVQGVGILSPDEASPTNHGRRIGVGTPLLPTPRRRERPYSGVGNGAVWTSALKRIIATSSRKPCH